jgi:microcystin-dependent protein
MSDQFVAEIRIFAGSFAPRGWAFCNGQVLPLSQNTALFSLLGFTYGGNGQTTFALPDLRGRAPLHAGQGSGLSQRDLGASGGQASVALTAAQLPTHTHSARARSGPGDQNSPAGNVWAGGVGRRGQLFHADAPGTAPGMSALALAATGGGQPHQNMPPYLALNFIIALEGIFPARP